MGKRKADDGDEIIERIKLPGKPIPTRNGPQGIIQDFTLNFLNDLKQNCNRDWMSINKSVYLGSKDNFLELISLCVDELHKVDDSLPTINPKNTLYRINRDIRFSNDKSLYRDHFGAFVCKEGKKSMLAGYYIHISPNDGTIIGGGMHCPSADLLKKFRDGILNNSKEFKDALSTKAVEKYFGNGLEKVLDTDKKLKKCPKGFEKDHSDIQILCLKSVVLSRKFTDDQVLSESFPKEVLNSLKALVPLIKAINRLVE
jgi:uncharacterized protein (TIGR02453 family)